MTFERQEVVAGSVILSVTQMRRFLRAQRFFADLRLQALMNNLWSNNPGELDRWADDGGRNNDSC